ncbi:MAG TPA: response regulator [Trichococcus sp.]|nr:response regulator [Trichococcus sp.]
MIEILVADDEFLTRHLFEDVIIKRLKQPNWKFRFCDNGQEALQCIRRGNPPIDIILLDIMMPGISGLELLEKIAEDFPLIRTIFISAYSEWGNIQNAMALGAFGFITKPIDFDVLEDTLKRAVKSRRKYIELLAALQEGRKHIGQAMRIIDIADKMIDGIQKNKRTERFTVPTKKKHE